MKGMTIIEKRDAILESLRAQFDAKVARVERVDGRSAHGPAREDFLRDLANNLAQALVEES